MCPAAPDGKLYDAYVSYLQPNGRSDQAAVFALQILPEKLETQHGYSLYIRGRDDSAGEGLEEVFPLPNQFSLGGLLGRPFIYLASTLYRLVPPKMVEINAIFS